MGIIKEMVSVLVVALAALIEVLQILVKQCSLFVSYYVRVANVRSWEILLPMLMYMLLAVVCVARRCPALTS